MPRPKPVAVQLRPHQQLIYDSSARFRVVACGRRWGKTELGKQLVLHHLAQGARGVWWLAPTYQMASGVWRDFKRTFRGVEGVRITESERQIDFADGAVLAIRSTHTPDHLRGAGLDFAVLDEAAFMPPTIWHEIVRPMLLDRRGGALLISSPAGKNWFYEVYQQGIHGGEWAAFHYPTTDNDALSGDDLTSIRKTTSERVWRQEYLAEFLDESGAVFREIRACATAPTNAAPQTNHHYVAGVDWGREGDYTVIVILDATDNSVVALDRFNQIGWEFQRGRLRALCERWRVAHILAEANSIGSVNIEALERDGLPISSFTMTSKSKPRLIESLSLAIETGVIRLLPDEILLAELGAYTLKRSSVGNIQYSAPPGLHDDCVIALGLAWQAAQQPTFSLDFV